jgi:lipid-A-disaccharide synthase
MNIWLLSIIDQKTVLSKDNPIMKIETRRDLFIFAGETSGDIHGGELIKEIRKIDPNLTISAVAGPEMIKQGIDLVLPISCFQVMGFKEIFFYLPKLIKYYFFLKKRILELNPKVCLFIDYPDFSFLLQSALRRNGYKGKIIHFICPSVWAWRKNRIKKMKKNIDLLLCIFPFEKRFLQNQLPTYYVGNPLIKKLQNYKPKEEWHLRHLPLIGIFPGSRSHEVEKNLPIQLEAAKELIISHPNFYFAISVANEKCKNSISEITNKFQKNFQEKLLFLPSSKNYDLMRNLRLALATSGTINLELAFHKVPTIVTYKIDPIDLFLAKNILKINLPFYCIVNIVAKKMIFPELYGYNLTKKNILYYLNKLLQEKSYEKEIIEGCEEVKNIFSKNEEEIDPAKAILVTLCNDSSKISNHIML